MIFYCIYCIIFIHLYRASYIMSLSEALLTTALILCRSWHAEALQATASEGLDQGPYVVTRAVFEPTTLRTKGTEHTTEPPYPHIWYQDCLCYEKELCCLSPQQTAVLSTACIFCPCSTLCDNNLSLHYMTYLLALCIRVRHTDCTQRWLRAVTCAQPPCCSTSQPKCSLDGSVQRPPSPHSNRSDTEIDNNTEN